MDREIQDYLKSSELRYPSVSDPWQGQFKVKLTMPISTEDRPQDEEEKKSVTDRSLRWNACPVFEDYGLISPIGSGSYSAVFTAHLLKRANVYRLLGKVVTIEPTEVFALRMVQTSSRPRSLES